MIFQLGGLVRQRRRQRGLPLPIADKVLPFRAASCGDASHGDERSPPTDEATADREQPLDPALWRAALAEACVVEAWARLAAAEQAGSARRVLDALEAPYLAKRATS
jgi:hypothetical protein